MIDFHTHLLPCIDDGANSVETAKRMIEQSKEQGVTTVLLTSHYYGKKRSPEQFLEKRAEAFALLKSVAPQGIDFRLAAEVHFTGDIIPSFTDLAKLKIEGTNYILLELPFTSVWRKDLLERIKEFIDETGLTPVLAHIERYETFQKNPKMLSKFVAAGCLTQLNAKAFLDKKRVSFAQAALRHGLAHCIGSDMHDCESRAQNLAFAKAEIGLPFEKLQENMQKILAGESVTVSYTPVKRFFGKYF